MTQAFEYHRNNSHIRPNLEMLTGTHICLEQNKYMWGYLQYRIPVRKICSLQSKA
jgi:hypothetical protein